MTPGTMILLITTNVTRTSALSGIRPIAMASATCLITGALRISRDAVPCGGLTSWARHGIHSPTVPGLTIPTQATPGYLRIHGDGRRTTMATGSPAQVPVGDGSRAAHGMD